MSETAVTFSDVTELVGDVVAGVRSVGALVPECVRDADWERDAALSLVVSHIVESGAAGECLRRRTVPHRQIVDAVAQYIEERGGMGHAALSDLSEAVEAVRAGLVLKYWHATERRAVDDCDRFARLVEQAHRC